MRRRSGAETWRSRDSGRSQGRAGLHGLPGAGQGSGSWAESKPAFSFRLQGPRGLLGPKGPPGPPGPPVSPVTSLHVWPFTALHTPQPTCGPPGLRAGRRADRHAHLPRAGVRGQQSSDAHVQMRLPSRCGFAGGFTPLPSPTHRCAAINSNRGVTFPPCWIALLAAPGKFWKEIEARGSRGPLSRWVASPGPGLAQPPSRSVCPASREHRPCPTECGPGSSANPSSWGFTWDQALPRPQRICHSDTWQAGAKPVEGGFPSEH